MLKLHQMTTSKANSLLLALLFLPAFNPALAQQASPPPVSAQQAPEQLPNQAPEQVESGSEETATRSPVYWLGKMADAVTNLEYRGLVTYEHVGMLETLEVIHGVRGGEQVERVRYLSGTPRELVSRGQDAHCRREGSPLSRAGLWSQMGQQNVQSLYHVLQRGRERVADRDAVVLELRPKDVHRLGMVVSVHEDTGLPLKSMLVNPNGQVLERYQFVELDLSPVKDEDLVAKSPDARESDAGSDCGSIVSRWQLRWVPPGFKPVASREIDQGELLVYSDGLSVFTVFVQALGPEMNFNGRAVRGATVAYMDHVVFDKQRYTITVVGEIPVQTAQLVARSVTGKH
ncbi:MucB/RseB C-terminal domain-containing protein [uncultured Microbulbifer sp.]|uniref:MucB/RseB C-terminal domain-containing protein n=1 Tax=uncultured Microbulbifer sp. TaxID=348147 RepID=UPI0025E25524|nr:MucB/RseB C-terminal domain-containing protein [uncultured Microbulbifer sp.]